MPPSCFKASSQFVMENFRLQLLKPPLSLNVIDSHRLWQQLHLGGRGGVLLAQLGPVANWDGALELWRKTNAG